MSSVSPSESGDALITLLRSWLSDETGVTFGYLVLYTSFGVVRGRTGLGFAQQLARMDSAPDVIELNEVTVEHYSNHLATATFDRLYVRLGEVRGFSLMEQQGSQT